ncbi:MAG: hypothetical protein IKW28_09495 [Lachnospiraceae bacterium]|nr:hypothetical protein [Lachnospiraceae bacterium]
MKKNKLKLFPVFLMLIAGSITSIMTYYFQYEIKAALLLLLSVLLIFYLLGLTFIRVIMYFDLKNEEEQRAREEEELIPEDEGIIQDDQGLKVPEEETEEE